MEDDGDAHEPFDAKYVNNHMIMRAKEEPLVYLILLEVCAPITKTLYYKSCLTRASVTVAALHGDHLRDGRLGNDGRGR